MIPLFAFWLGASVLSLYVPLCLVLVLFPEIFHKKKCLGFPVQLTAHRGGAGERLENTIAAFRWAVEGCHADMLELDVHLTKDKQVVVVHDRNLERITGVMALVEDLNFDELPRVKQQLPVTFSDSHCETLCEDRKIPLFSDVLEAFPNMPMNIDLKQASRELIVKTSDLIHEYKREKITLWGSVSSTVLEQCHHYDPSIPLYFSKRRVFLYPLLFWTGILAFLPIREAAYEVPLPSIYLGRQFRQGRLFNIVGPMVAYIWELFLLNQIYISYLRRRGVPTIIWVLNNTDEYERAYRLGAEGVHTDFPSRLRSFLSSSSTQCFAKSS